LRRELATESGAKPAFFARAKAFSRSSGETPLAPERARETLLGATPSSAAIPFNDPIASCVLDFMTPIITQTIALIKSFLLHKATFKLKLIAQQFA
jgi:hypothetical protein